MINIFGILFKLNERYGLQKYLQHKEQRLWYYGKRLDYYTLAAYVFMRL